MPSQEAKHPKQQQSKPNSVPGRVSYFCVILRFWSCGGCFSTWQEHSEAHSHEYSCQRHVSTDTSLRMQPYHSHPKRSKSRTRALSTTVWFLRSPRHWILVLYSKSYSSEFLALNSVFLHRPGFLEELSRSSYEDNIRGRAFESWWAEQDGEWKQQWEALAGE